MGTGVTSGAVAGDFRLDDLLEQVHAILGVPMETSDPRCLRVVQLVRQAHYHGVALGRGYAAKVAAPMVPAETLELLLTDGDLGGASNVLDRIRQAATSCTGLDTTSSYDHSRYCGDDYRVRVSIELLEKSR